ncbi:MAG: bifunctional phosphoribosylaminoimidazolecarboxamide formyltransferase/IMP cyclohydrolase [Clostridium sp.]
MKKALISVSDKNNLISFAKFLIDSGYEIISTGGTYNYLVNNNIPATSVKSFTGFEEILDGRVKTLHPKIHSGILYKRDNPSHVEDIKSIDSEGIDMVVVNLYPFFNKVNSNISFDEKIEFIDIGGPTLLRGAAKNFKHCLPVIDPEDYPLIKEKISSDSLDILTRKYLAGKTFSYISSYDNAIGRFLSDEKYPDTFNLSYKKEFSLRYGENPHQSGAFYTSINDNGFMKSLKKLQGKELSYNNIRDIDAAIKVVSEFTTPACCGVKHNVPCGAALGIDSLDAYKLTYKCDSEAIFGGIVAFNSLVNKDCANEMISTFLEVIIAPSFTDEALEVLSQKKNLRVITYEYSSDSNEVISVSGGLLVQDRDSINSYDLNYVTNLKPSNNDIDDMIFGMKVIKHVKSNAIIIVKNGATISIAPGQVSRIKSAKNAVEWANTGGVLVSDAFFPFSDIVELCKSFNITSIVQPGGSVNDNLSIDKCNELNIPMVFTGIRHFKH